MSDLKSLKADYESARTQFTATLEARFPGMDEWHWHRTCGAAEGRIGRHNDDTTHDAALAADPDIKAAWDEYIRLLHALYRARDGEGGVLGGRA